jgi:O-antigen/teichoic acid export membrane protein
MARPLGAPLKAAVKGTTLVLAGMVAGRAMWFAIKVLIVRNLSVEDFGLYSLTLTILAVVSALAPLGAGAGAVRYITLHTGQDRREEARAVSRAALHIGLASSTAFFLLTFVLADLAARYVFYKPELTSSIRIIAVSVPLTVMTGLLLNILRSHGFIRPRVYYMDIGHPLYYLSFLGVLSLPGFSYKGVLFAYVLATALVFVSVASYGYGKLTISPVPLRKGREYRDILAFSLPLMAAGIGGLVMTWTDILMLGRYVASAEVGFYNIGMSLARLLLLVLMAAGFIFFPLAGEMFARGQRAELQRTYQVLTKWIFMATLPLFYVVFFFPETTIRFFFGPDLLQAALPLRILAAAFIFHVFVGPNILLLTAAGRSRPIMNIFLGTATLNVALNWVLIKHLGMGTEGAALATLVSYALLNIMASFVLYRGYGLHPFSRAYLRPLLGSGVAAVLLYALAKSLPLHMWMMPLYLLAFLGGYVLSLLLSRSVDEEDLQLLHEVRNRLGLKLHWLEHILERFAHTKH